MRDDDELAGVLKRLKAGDVDTTEKETKKRKKSKRAKLDQDLDDAVDGVAGEFTGFVR